MSAQIIGILRGTTRKWENLVYYRYIQQYIEPRAHIRIYRVSGKKGPAVKGRRWVVDGGVKRRQWRTSIDLDAPHDLHSPPAHRVYIYIYIYRPCNFIILYSRRLSSGQWVHYKVLQLSALYPESLVPNRRLPPPSNIYI